MRATDEALLAGVTADILGTQLERVLTLPGWITGGDDEFWPVLAVLAYGEYKRELRRLERKVKRAQG